MVGGSGFECEHRRRGFEYGKVKNELVDNRCMRGISRKGEDREMQRGMEIRFSNGCGETRDRCSNGGYGMLEACCYNNDGHWRGSCI